MSCVRLKVIEYGGMSLLRSVIFPGPLACTESYVLIDDPYSLEQLRDPRMNLSVRVLSFGAFMPVSSVW
jgi:hypothetical protein